MDRQGEHPAAVRARAALLGSLTERWRPEDTVGPIITLISEDLDRDGRHLLETARPRWRWSSQPDRFVQAAPLDRQAATVARLGTELSLAPLRARLARRHARLTQALEKRRGDWRRRLPALAQFAETAFASTLTEADFRNDATLCFVAYMTARLGLRSVFTNTRQAGAFDTVAALLLSRLGDGADWPATAAVFPRADVLVHLSEVEKLSLLERASAVLEEVAGYLQKTAAAGHISLDTMIVHRGNDSSTWNALAGAWNRARDVYLAALDGLGWLGTLEACCPGKVLRLMAADVAVWHGGRASDLHPDTRVWGELPPPWRVLSGERECTRTMVAAACRRHGVDPEASGWTGPRARTAVEPFRPTPELVHGVEVGYPALAGFLRRIGVFSGKALRLSVPLVPSARGV